MMSGCTDYHSGKRPTDYGRAKWISESPDIWFIVKDPDIYGENLKSEGEIKVGGESISFTQWFDMGKSVYFSDGDQELFSGSCKFSPEKLVVKIYKDKDKVFNGEVDEIVFIRTSIDE